MTDDRLSRQANRDAFDAIVSQVVDPERRYFRRLFLILGAIFSPLPLWPSSSPAGGGRWWWPSRPAICQA